MSAAPAPGGSGGQYPRTMADLDAVRRAMSNTQGKSYGGLRGDSAALNWILAILEIGAAGAVTAFSWTFLSQYGQNADKFQQDFSTAYYVCEFIFPWSILTMTALTIYVLWVFADGRHPMRRAWLHINDNLGEGGKFLDNYKRPVQYPGFGTMSVNKISRLTLSRLFAERQHVQKMTWFYVVLFTAWFIPFMIMTFAHGYLTWQKMPTNHNIKIVQICGAKDSNKICWELAKTGISAGCVSVLMLINIIATIVATMARPSSANATT